ncbi:MAG TPA: hypothetical protein VMF11_11445 [Candidatus Baltobacteraceae bacterium]|nr:hypothetical protein [Candidatus Baltobacteraceae bacterium]
MIDATTTTRIRSLNVIQLALMLGVLYALFGIIAGLIAGLAASTAGSAFGGYGMPNFGAISIVLFPIFYGVLLFIGGFLYGLIGGALYNLVAGWIGGIEMRLETRV